VTPYEPVGWAARPSPTRRFLPTLLVLAVLGVVGYVGFRAATQEPAATPGALPPSPITGVVIAVDSQGLGQVRAFAIKLPDGSAFDLALGPLENATEFSPAHLSEHMATSEPIRAYYRIEAGVPTVYRVEDAST
jgi:hypothetical protein